MTHHQYHTIAPCCREINTRSLSCRESANSISIPKRVVSHADINPCIHAAAALWNKAW
jgi:hypothetical protein